MRNIDLDILREAISKMYEANNLKPFEKNYTFYFDETNNFRKFSLEPSKTPRVNAEKALSSDFILGGICFNNIPNCEEIFDFFYNEGINKELKSKHIFRHNDFQYDFSSERATALLRWFDNNPDVYLHYVIENNLYFALVDIVDSLLENYPPKLLIYSFQLKDALYRICKQNQEEVLNLLCKFEYPNISKFNIQQFSQQLGKIIEYGNIEEEFYTEMLRQMFKSVKEKTEMAFIVDNKPFILQDGYSVIYLNRMIDFESSTLIFDHETKVIKYLENANALQQISNCSFVNSDTEKFIQISDCIIACLSKTFNFIDKYDSSSITRLKIDCKMKNNLRSLKSLIDRSDGKSNLLLSNLNARSVWQERRIKLDLICR